MKTIPADLESTKTVGRPKSGKPWKKLSRPARALNAELNTMIEKPTFDHRQATKAKDLEARAFEASLKEAKSTKKREDRSKTEAKKKRKELNAVRSGQYQLITNTKKLKKWSKKMRSQLMRLPTEEYYKVINKPR